MTVRCPLWLVQIVWVGLIVGIGAGVIDYMQQRARDQVLVVYDSFANEMSDNMAGAVDSIVSGIRDASLMVDVFEPRLATCSAPPVNYTGEVLLRALTALPDPPGGRDSTWLSLGVMQRASDALEPPANVTTKWSWQMALGFGCPEYIYAYIDAQTAPAFLGYCARLTANNSLALDTKVAYNGTDWGFTPLERDMLFEAKYNESFVPVKALLGTLEFSYRRLVRCGIGGKPYALVFASRSIAQLDAALAAQRADNAGVAFVIERTTGLLIAASVANQTHVPGTETRVAARNATDVRIRDAALYLQTETNGTGYARVAHKPEIDDAVYVTALPYAPARGVDWLLVVAVDSRNITGPFGDATTARASVLAIFVVLVVVTALGTFFCVTLPVRRMLTSARGQRSQLWWFAFSEIRDIDEALLRAEK